MSPNPNPGPLDLLKNEIAPGDTVVLPPEALARVRGTLVGKVEALGRSTEGAVARVVFVADVTLPASELVLAQRVPPPDPARGACSWEDGCGPARAAEPEPLAAPEGGSSS